MKQSRQVHVGVIGGRECGRETAALAFETGRRIAESGWILVCGGGGGVMAEACRGAREAGGLTVGILPGLSREEANPYLSCSVVTGMGEMRNALVVRSSQAIVALEGGCGTLAEIALANCAGVPVVGLRSWRCRPGDNPGRPALYAFEADDATAAVAWLRRKLAPEA